MQAHRGHFQVLKGAHMRIAWRSCWVFVIGCLGSQVGPAGVTKVVQTGVGGRGISRVRILATLPIRIAERDSWLLDGRLMAQVTCCYLRWPVAIRVLIVTRGFYNVPCSLSSGMCRDLDVRPFLATRFRGSTECSVSQIVGLSNRRGLKTRPDESERTYVVVVVVVVVVTMVSPVSSSITCPVVLLTAMLRSAEMPLIWP